jgi:glycosyltransferase involved in cell wall biosynthesis
MRHMDIQGTRVLIDGYNLRLSATTGIKTYGITLLKALKMLGVEVNLLWDTPYANSQQVRELLAFDHRKDPTRGERLRSLVRLALRPKAQIVFDDKRLVVPDEGLSFLQEVDRLFTVPRCYEAANIIYERIGLPTVIRMPDPKISIWHATHFLPITIHGAAKITTIHDLIPIRLPYTTLDKKSAYYRLVKKSINESKLIIAVSNATKNDICDMFEVPSEKIVVTYQAIEPQPVSEGLIDIAMRKYRLKPKRYILFVGTIEPKKNIGRLIDAYAAIDTDMPLVIVGKRGWLWEGEIGKVESIFGRQHMRKVRLLDWVPKADLGAIYAGAYCFIFPSIYEGFGLPPLEAMSHGIPVICSNTSSLPEICGNAAIYVDPYDVHSIREGLEKLISDRALGERLGQIAREQVAEFSMERYVPRLREAYLKALS